MIPLNKVVFSQLIFPQAKNVVSIQLLKGNKDVTFVWKTIFQSPVKAKNMIYVKFVNISFRQLKQEAGILPIKSFPRMSSWILRATVMLVVVEDINLVVIDIVVLTDS